MAKQPMKWLSLKDSGNRDRYLFSPVKSVDGWKIRNPLTLRAAYLEGMQQQYDALDDSQNVSGEIDLCLGEATPLLPVNRLVEREILRRESLDSPAIAVLSLEVGECQ